VTVPIAVASSSRESNAVGGRDTVTQTSTVAASVTATITTTATSTRESELFLRQFMAN
jgi:hypothetical protein